MVHEDDENKKSGGDNSQVFLVPTVENLTKINMMTKSAMKGGPRTTAYSTISNFSRMSNASFFKMIDSPFGLAGGLAHA